MIVQEKPKPLLDYSPCRYGASRIPFRGPERTLDGPYVSVIGGSESYGKFVSKPFANLLEERLETPVVNLAAMHAGLTLIVDDPAILTIASASQMTIVQVLGAQNMSNRYYSVHPRRNDRFVGASDQMQAMFPDVDFTEFNFTGHLMSSLEERKHPALPDLIAELKTAWVQRMKLILSDIASEKILLWMSERAPEETAPLSDVMDPHYVDRDMLEALSPYIAGIVEVVTDDDTATEDMVGKLYTEGEKQAAAALPGPAFHSKVADQIAGVMVDPEQKRRAKNFDAPPLNSLPIRAFR